MSMNQNDIQIMIKQNNLVLEGYKPGNVRLYALYDYNQRMVSDGYMTFKELCAFLRGYNAGWAQCQNQMSKD